MSPNGNPPGVDTEDVCRSLDLDPEERRACRRAMLRAVEGWLDECGEVNCTALAESIADDLGLYAPGGYAIVHDVFDLAVDVAQEYERAEVAR